MRTTTPTPEATAYFCPACRTLVGLEHGKFGPYVANLSRAYNGVRYPRGAHQCPPGVEEAHDQRMAEADAHLEAEMAYYDDGVADWDH